MASDINCAAWSGLFRDDDGWAALADSSDEPVGAPAGEALASQRETVRCVQKAIDRQVYNRFGENNGAMGWMD